MTTPAFRRLTISAAAALLAACGGSQPPLNSSPAGSALQRSPARPYRVLYSFGRSGDGMNPFAGLTLVNGMFYGTTANGGANGSGTVYAIAKNGKETVLHSFGSSGDGMNPFAGLTEARGVLYSTTSDGGADDLGTVFAINKSGK